MIDYVYLIQIQYIICILVYLLEKIVFKYNYCKDIVKKLLYVKKYDGIHSISILYLIFDIKIYTLQFLSTKLIKIYYENKKISDICIKNEKNITCINKIILSIVYLDQYYFINLIEVYNCGIVYHSTKLFTHIYNYIGERRIEKSILPNINYLSSPPWS